MHEFDFINSPKDLLTPEVVALLSRLHECRGGTYKNSDNIIAEKHADGTETVRFRPVPAFQSSESSEKAAEMLLKK